MGQCSQEVCKVRHMTEITTHGGSSTLLPMDSHICNPERAISLMKQCSMSMLKEDPKFHLLSNIWDKDGEKPVLFG